jgi:hypothetical protein
MLRSPGRRIGMRTYVLVEKEDWTVAEISTLELIFGRRL